MDAVAHIVDDDEAIRDALSFLLRTRGIASRCWESAERFLSDYSSSMRGCLVLDVRMTGMTGVECFEALRERGCRMPVIFLTGHGDVPMAVEALRGGAWHFFEKPFNNNALADAVQEAIARDAVQRHAEADRDEIEKRLAQLTQRESEVMRLILDGRLNKVIADELDISMRTVEVHRARIFEKMGVRSAVELARLLGDAR